MSRARRSDGKARLFFASQWTLIWWKFRKHKVAVAALCLLGLFYLGVVFAEVIAPYDPRTADATYIHVPPQRVRFVDSEGRFHARPFVYGLTGAMDMDTLNMKHTVDTSRVYPLGLFVHGDRYRMWSLFEWDLHLFGTRDPSGRVFLFGTDRLGQDLLSRIIYGGRVSLTVGLVGIAISFFLGILIGGISGYFGGRVDLVIQRAIELIMSIPHLPLWAGLSAALPPFWSITQVYFGIVVILALVGWTSLARVVRGKFMAVKKEDFVMNARLDGAGPLRIIFRYLLPSFASHVIAALTLAMPSMIIGETSLSFIGLGLQNPAISWGVLLKEAQSIRALAAAPWLLIPGLFVIVVVLAFNYLGDGLRDAADPYVRT
jgi:peptide/nickel transport system permease protein